MTLSTGLTEFNNSVITSFLIYFMKGSRNELCHEHHTFITILRFCIVLKSRFFNKKWLSFLICEWLHFYSEILHS